MKTIGQQVEYLSTVLMPAKRFEEYQKGMAALLADGIEYIDPVHTLHGKNAVLEMLARYVPRAANGDFSFQLLVDTETQAIWRWTLSLKIRFTWFKFTINGLVHAQIKDGKIVYQREYYDPMESIEVIPFFGKFYKLILRWA